MFGVYFAIGALVVAAIGLFAIWYAERQYKRFWTADRVEPAEPVTWGSDGLVRMSTATAQRLEEISARARWRNKERTADSREVARILGIDPRGDHGGFGLMIASGQDVAETVALLIEYRQHEHEVAN